VTYENVDNDDYNEFGIGYDEVFQGNGVNAAETSNVASETSNTIKEPKSPKWFKNFTDTTEYDMVKKEY
jgi:hypothetical protein